MSTMDKFGPDGVRVDGAGHLIWEGVETTIDGPDWVAVTLTYGPNRRALDTVRRLIAAEANACPAPGRCGLFLHAPDCPRRPSPLTATGAPIRRDRTAPTIDIDHSNRPHHTAAFRGNH